jgi:hypothetical protein
MYSTLPFDLETMRRVDIRTVNPASLIDIRNTKVNLELPYHEKVIDFLEQIINPYCFLCGDVVVKVAHSETDKTVQDCVESFLSSL